MVVIQNPDASFVRVMSYVPLFTPDRRVQVLLYGILLLVAVYQPVSGVVFVLDGVLIGAGDNRFLAVASIRPDGTAARTATAGPYLRRTGQYRPAVFRHHLTRPRQLNREGGRSMGIAQRIRAW